MLQTHRVEKSDDTSLVIFIIILLLHICIHIDLRIPIPRHYIYSVHWFSLLSITSYPFQYYRRFCLSLSNSRSIYIFNGCLPCISSFVFSNFVFAGTFPLFFVWFLGALDPITICLIADGPFFPLWTDFMFICSVWFGNASAGIYEWINSNCFGVWVLKFLIIYLYVC